MLTISIDLLTGRYAATRFDDRNRTEWPPHPGRVFSALVAAWADSDEPDAGEREVLEWLETLGPPEICASEAVDRAAVTFYVPNNEAGNAVVKDQTRNYAVGSDLRSAVVEAEAALATASDPKVVKAATKARTALDRHLAKEVADSVKAAGRKPRESDSVVADGVQLLPDERGRQPRTFPVAIPHEPVVSLSWPDAEPTPAQRDALDALLGRVARLGHSSSMVSCRVAADAPDATLVPDDERGETPIRVVGPGLLRELELSFSSHQGNEPRVLPSVMARYRKADEQMGAPPTSVFGRRWIVLELGSGSSLPLTRTLDLTRAVRGALMHHAAQPLPEILSGHQPGVGETPPSERAHTAFVPLPFVGRQHADGLIRGIGIVVPREATEDERLAVAEAVRSWLSATAGRSGHVQMGRAGTLDVSIVADGDRPASLRPWMWSRPSRRWATVTPVALDQFPGGLWSADSSKREAAEGRAVAGVKRACTHIGLPEPQEVVVSRAAPVVGVPALGRFPTYRSPRRPTPRPCAHVRLSFAEPVHGPVVIGAGRYFGYGLFLPADPREPRVP